ncbi:28S ribosomal protein S28, mitochondrial, partial [Stegodyphus mimosarum]
MLLLVNRVRVLYSAIPKTNFPYICRILDNSRTFSTENSNKQNEITIGGLAKALGKFRELEHSEGKDIKTTSEEPKSFLHLLRHSQFVQMGDPRGKTVIGKIFQVVNTDLYIDFGGKFYCVCRKPKRNSE